MRGGGGGDGANSSLWLTGIAGMDVAESLRMYGVYFLSIFLPSSMDCFQTFLASLSACACPKANRTCFSFRFVRRLICVPGLSLFFVFDGVPIDLASGLRFWVLLLPSHLYTAIELPHTVRDHMLRFCSLLSSPGVGLRRPGPGARVGETTRSFRPHP
ncbi:hypothetical protein R3P38DRAFT_323921 [Favolaschia claudopus]|uniref:Uncharacterized protein n=1 Tax=Favolaschia claudopus TaxID=2862362 RepID=A0AAW0CW12_9AGAR